jgi:hypothetical protein
MADVTEKQSAFIDSLLEGREIPADYVIKLAELRPNLDRVAASTIIEQLLGMPKKATSWIVPDTIPDGRYAIVGTDNTWRFFRVTTSRNNGRRYVQKVLGSPGDFRYTRVSAADWRFAVAEIVKDPALASQAFGMQVGACGICGSPLTDPESIARGIGPICAKKYDW